MGTVAHLLRLPMIFLQARGVCACCCDTPSCRPWLARRSLVHAYTNERTALHDCSFQDKPTCMPVVATVTHSGWSASQTAGPFPPNIPHPHHDGSLVWSKRLTRSGAAHQTRMDARPRPATANTSSCLVLSPVKHQLLPTTIVNNMLLIASTIGVHNT